MAVLVLLGAALPAAAQLVGDDTAPDSSCAGYPQGATRVTADADQDGAQVVLICDGTLWRTQGTKISYDSAACTSAKDGTIRYSSTNTPRWEYCDGGATTWRPFEHAGGGLCAPPALCPNVGDVCDDSNPATTHDPIFAGFIIDPAAGSECRTIFLTRSAQGWSLQWSTADGVDHIANDSMWDGRVNDSQIPNSTDFPAAKLCKDLDYGGFTDWYLPAKEELNIINYNRDAITPSLTDGWGWNTVSSSEYDDNEIWLQYINITGESRRFAKTAAVFEARCIRTESASGGSGGACPAGGVEVGGACWYHGWNGQSCADTCTERGLSYSDATRDYAGSGGSASVAQCNAVLIALHYDGSEATNGSCGQGVGCAVYEGWPSRCTSPATTAGAAASAERVCACE